MTRQDNVHTFGGKQTYTTCATQTIQTKFGFSEFTVWTLVSFYTFKEPSRQRSITWVTVCIHETETEIQNTQMHSLL